jgi:hypothetical protein
MQRHQWNFDYTIKDVYNGATAKMLHHRERMAWWTDKKDEVKEQLQSNGITIDESLANLATNSTYGRSETITLDSKLVKDFNECVQKIAEHKAKATEYEGWHEVLKAQSDPSARLHLNHDDWLFFYSQK